jgi:hypothetical protein
VRYVLGRPHPAGGHRGEIGVPDLGRYIRVAFDWDESRCDRIHGDAERSELVRPAAAEADLCALRRDVGRSARRGSVHNLGVDLDDAPPAPHLHPRNHRPAEQHRALDEEVELREVFLPRHLDQRRLRLRTGGIEHQDIDWTDTLGHRVDELNDLPLVGDVSREGDGNPATALDCVDNRERHRVVAHAIHSHREAILG